MRHRGRVEQELPLRLAGLLNRAVRLDVLGERPIYLLSDRVVIAVRGYACRRRRPS